MNMKFDTAVKEKQKTLVMHLVLWALMREPWHALSLHWPLLPKAAPEPVLVPPGNFLQVFCSG